MRLNLDTTVFAQNNLSAAELYLLLSLQADGNIEKTLHAIVEKGFITKYGNLVKEWELTDSGAEHINTILIESDKTVPNKSRCDELAIKLIELFPKGMKSNNIPWRGNKRDISLKLQKFFKLYGNTWSDDDVIDATQRYINHFNGDYSYMRVLKYFIMKSEPKFNEEGVRTIEDISELATWLENDTSEEKIGSWLSDLK